MASVSTHVLDQTAGAPAVGVRVELARLPGGDPVAEGVTNADGRIPDLASGLQPGDYELVAHLGDHFRAHGAEPFLTQLVVRFRIASDRHHHVPVLATPFAAATYLGS